MPPETETVVITPPSPETAAAAVEIARIEAERDVTLAEIHTDSNEAQTEAALAAASETDEDVLWLQNDLASLREQCATNVAELSNLRETVAMLETRLLTQEQMTALLALLTPPPNSEDNSQPANQDENTEADGPRENQGQDNPADETPPAPAEPRKKRRFLQ